MPIHLPPGARRAPLPTADTTPLGDVKHRGADPAADADLANAADAASRLAGGRTPGEVFEGNVGRLGSPSSALAPTRFPGYRWDPQDLDAVMRQFGIGDAEALVRTAVALDQGDKYLTRHELVVAARAALRGITDGYRWSPAVLAEVMKGKGLVEEGALLRAARRVDDGDHVLTRPELERAADVLLHVVQANDVMAILERVGAAAQQPGVEVETLGVTDDIPVQALHFEATSGKPLLRVIVTGGVHGDEPCGAGAATLLIEQLLLDPRIRQDVSFTVVPLVNPRGLAQGTRRTPEDVDLNRVFVGKDDDPQESDFIQGLVERRRYDLALDLHSGGHHRNGFWVLHRGSEDVLAPAMERFGEEFPRLFGDADPYTLTSDGVATSSSTATLKDLAKNAGARWAMTVEAPGSVSYLDQVLGENSIVHEVVREAMLRVTKDSV